MPPSIPSSLSGLDASLEARQPRPVNSVTWFRWDRLETLTSAVELCSVPGGSFQLLIAQSAVPEPTQFPSSVPSAEQPVELLTPFHASSTIRITARQRSPTTFRCSKPQPPLLPLLTSLQLFSDPLSSAVEFQSSQLDGDKQRILEQSLQTCSSLRSQLWPTRIAVLASALPTQPECSTTPSAHSHAPVRGEWNLIVFITLRTELIKCFSSFRTCMGDSGKLKSFLIKNISHQLWSLNRRPHRHRKHRRRSRFMGHRLRHWIARCVRENQQPSRLGPIRLRHINQISKGIEPSNLVHTRAIKL